MIVQCPCGETRKFRFEHLHGLALARLVADALRFKSHHQPHVDDWIRLDDWTRVDENRIVITGVTRRPGVPGTKPPR
jgi:hypothetical protein